MHQAFLIPDRNVCLGSITLLALVALAFLLPIETRSRAAELTPAETIATDVRQLSGIARGICTILVGDKRPTGRSENVSSEADGTQIGQLAVEPGATLRIPTKIRTVVVWS